MKLLLSIPPEWLIIFIIVLAFAIGCGIGWFFIKKKQDKV
jgi:uncharacterized protein YneF (UPF0154 family)